MILRRTLLAFVALGSVLAAAGGAGAATTLVTGALPLDATTSYRCVAVNIGKTPVSGMAVSIINSSTTPPSTTTTVCGTIAAGKTCAILAGDDTSGDVYCTIAAQTTARNLRGTLMAVLAGGAIGATSDAR